MILIVLRISDDKRFIFSCRIQNKLMISTFSQINIRIWCPSSIILNFILYISSIVTSCLIDDTSLLANIVSITISPITLFINSKRGPGDHRSGISIINRRHPEEHFCPRSYLFLRVQTYDNGFQRI